MDGKRGNANLVTQWAVDIDPMAIETFKTNNPKSIGFVHGTDEYLYLLRRWDALCTELENFDVGSESAKAKKKQKANRTLKKITWVRPKPASDGWEQAEAAPKKDGKKRKGGAKAAKEEDEDEDEQEEFRVRSFPPPVAQWRPDSIALPIQPPCDFHGPGNYAAEVRTARRRWNSLRSCSSSAAGSRRASRSRGRTRRSWPRRTSRASSRKCCRRRPSRGRVTSTS
jgi:hypothetical protein